MRRAEIFKLAIYFTTTAQGGKNEVSQYQFQYILTIPSLVN